MNYSGAKCFKTRSILSRLKKVKKSLRGNNKMSQGLVSVEKKIDNGKLEQDSGKSFAVPVLMDDIKGNMAINPLSQNVFDDAGDIIFTLSKSFIITS
ncbi:hypothetical protein ACFL6P_09540 [Candidatus Latescibacterota bacterium]